MKRGFVIEIELLDTPWFYVKFYWSWRRFKANNRLMLRWIKRKFTKPPTTQTTP